MDRPLALFFVAAVLVPAAAVSVSGCASTPPPVAVETELPPVPEPTVLASPVPYRIGITRWEPGPLTEAFARRLRKANLFVEVYYPLESGAEMDAAIELDVRRTYHSAPTAFESFLQILAAGMHGRSDDTRFRADLCGDLAVRVGERTLRTFEKTVQVYVRVLPHSPRTALEHAEDEIAGETLAALLVDEICKEPAALAADIASGPGGSAP